MRNFESGATRSNSGGKIEYFGFRHPLCELSFGKYMRKHQVQEDGKLRASDNWWKGWDKKISLESMVRHVEDLQAIYSGKKVFKVRNSDKTFEETYYVDDDEELVVNEGYIYEEVNEEECVNAVRFNTTSYLLNILTNK